MSKEIWKPVVGYEGSYEVSNNGRIFSIPRLNSRGFSRRGRFLKPAPDTSGHLQVGLSRNGIQSRKAVHRLVLEAFVGPCPPGMEACHWDDDPTNNRLENLRWDTRSANDADMVRNGNHNMARKMFCKHGHPFDAVNTYVKPNGSRDCRECRRNAAKKHRDKAHFVRKAA